MSSKRCVKKIFISCATEVEDCLLRFRTHMNNSSTCCVRQSNKLSLSQFTWFPPLARRSEIKLLRFLLWLPGHQYHSSQQQVWGQVETDKSPALTRCSAWQTKSLVIHFPLFFFFYCYTGLYCAWQCEHASAHVIFKTSRLLEHMDTNRWAQSDTRHLGNKHLVGAALALFLDPPLGLGCLMRHQSLIKKKKSNNNSNRTCVWSLQGRAGSVLTGQIPMLLCRIRYIVIRMDNPVCYCRQIWSTSTYKSTE